MVPYGRALALQQGLWAKVKEELPGAVLGLEHAPVITCGRNFAKENLLTTEKALAKEGIELFYSDRGGEVTAHNPGQLVMYVMFPLAFVKGPKHLVWMLEESLIRTLGQWDLKAHRDPRNPGIWLGNKKIAALGIRIKDRVSYHGIALNVSNDLGIFDHIIPCGLKTASVTSVEVEVGQKVNLVALYHDLSTQLGGLLGTEFEGAASWRVQTRDLWIEP